ncbi:hypothetical protein PFISCL1PPCAC_10553 [Pristionchus fissidentatus]|uniref:Protein kinase domain-containing protein n=1 Tax=Pristionchus fissidentatus TaxID=1538716 RepID=A0AAV5VIP7_9BILA|nr:hypothetical protein PFISCL1PPCAC_10553 [Pristionchus fissidentatus]
MHSELSSGDAAMLKGGEVIDGRFHIMHMLNVGGFGQVFVGIDQTNGTQVAIKVESLKASIQLIENEVECLKNAGLCAGNWPSPIVQLYSSGCTQTVRYMVMELVGRNMRELKKMTACDQFSIYTSLWVMREMVTSLQYLHATGWIHRDVKPPNFCVSLEGQRRLYLVDFGMSRRYKEIDGTMRRKEARCSFHGTVRYASPGCHEGRDVSRFDDLWSVYFIACENALGELPWRHSNEKETVRKMKNEIDLLHPQAWQMMDAPLSIRCLRDTLIASDSDDDSFYREPPYAALNQSTVSIAHPSLLLIDLLAFHFTCSLHSLTSQFTCRLMNCLVLAGKRSGLFSIGKLLVQ